MTPPKSQMKTTQDQDTAWTWLILAGLMMLIILVLIVTTLQRLEVGEELQEQALYRQGLDRVQALEGAVRATMRRGFWRPRLLQTLIEEMLEDPKLTGLAIIGPGGKILAQSGAQGWPMNKNNALAGLPPGFQKKILEGAPIVGFVGEEFVTGIPFEPLRRFKGMGRSVPEWAKGWHRNQEPHETKATGHMRRHGMGPNRELPPGPPMNRQMGTIRPPSIKAYALVRLSARLYQASRIQALHQAIFLGLLIFLAAGTAASVIWATARRRAQEMNRLKKEVADSRHLAALGRLAGSVAHEVRNPLSALRGMVQYLAKDRPKGSREAEMAATAVSEVDRLERVVSGLLEYTRPRPPRCLPMDIGESLQSAANLLSGDPRAEDVEIKVELAPKLPMAKADPDQIRQVLVNLLVNSLQAMNGQGEVLLKAKAKGKQVIVTVKDTGPGLPEGDPQQLFDPFFSTKTRGTGLGLAIAKRIIKGHGGTLSAENDKKQGAVITFTLPKAD